MEIIARKCALMRVSADSTAENNKIGKNSAKSPLTNHPKSHFRIHFLKKISRFKVTTINRRLFLQKILNFPGPPQPDQKTT